LYLVVFSSTLYILLDIKSFSRWASSKRS